jgi:mitogen-activated protein kinase organizer 1
VHCTKLILFHYLLGELTHDKIGISINSMAITSDEQCLLLSCQDECIRLVDIDGGDILTEYKGHKGSKDYRMECDFVMGDGYVITGSNDGEVLIYDFLEANVVRKLKIGMTNIISSLCKHPTKDQILFANGREVQSWGISESMTIDFE